MVIKILIIGIYGRTDYYVKVERKSVNGYVNQKNTNNS